MTKLQTAEINPLHKQIIDEYHINGFNKVKACLAIQPELSYYGANTLAKTVFKLEQNKEYIKDKQDSLRANAHISNEAILTELISFAYSDVTDYIGLTSEELKALPPAIRRCLDSVQIKKRRGTTRSGDPFEEEIVVFKLVDKTKALEMINKHIGFYAEDNAQKTPLIDLSKASKEQLQVLLELVESQKKLKP
jgi:hypothetical protein